MKQVYLLSDWTSASKMRNEKNPSLRVSVGVFPDSEGKSGYRIVVYNTLNSHTEYLFYVDSTDHWSLSSEEAIEVLNQIGFPCELDQGLVLPQRVVDTLYALRILGYSYILRTSGAVFIQKSAGGTRTLLSEITEYSLIDFSFLEVDNLTSILSILEKGKVIK